ncbi:hypothetical protein C8R45DRAFT_841955, partial [Mycena sanguinolenta]
MQGPESTKKAPGKKDADRGADSDKENEEDDENGAEEDEDFDSLSITTIEDFLAAISMDEDCRTFGAFVDTSVLAQSGRELADAIASEIFEATGYRFIYFRKYEQQCDVGTRYQYYCVQNQALQKKSKKHDDPEKHRDKRQMITFDCHGYLYITTYDDSCNARVSLKHSDNHVVYQNRDVPQNVKEYIAANPDLTTSQVWSWVLRLPEYQNQNCIKLFPRRAIYRIIHMRDSVHYRRDDDELKSARKIIEEASREQRGEHNKQRIYRAEAIPLPDADGFSAVAFALPDPICKWGGHIRELALDSAWSTDRAQYEVFSVLGEVAGSGCPLGYLLIKSEKGSEPGAKQKFIAAVLAYLRGTWEIRPVTKTGRRSTRAGRNFQRAIKRRLAVLKRQPAPYDFREACREFDFIDPKFVPVGQATEIL